MNRLSKRKTGRKMFYGFLSNINLSTTALQQAQIRALMKEHCLMTQVQHLTLHSGEMSVSCDEGC